MRIRRSAGRPRDPWKAAFFGLAVVALIAGVAWALLGSSLLVVRSVQVSGAGQVPATVIIARAGIRIGTPLIRVDTGAAARRVEQITQVQSARVIRSWPDAIVIVVTPRVAVLAVRSGAGYALVDAYGVALAWQPRRPGNLPLLVSPAGPVAALRGNRAVYAAGTVVRGLPGRLRRLVVAVTAAGPDAVRLLLRGGVTVVWGSTSRAAAKAGELTILLRTRVRYYDISDPGTAVTGR